MKKPKTRESEPTIDAEFAAYRATLDSASAAALDDKVAADVVLLKALCATVLADLAAALYDADETYEAAHKAANATRDAAYRDARAHDAHAYAKGHVSEYSTYLAAHCAGLEIVNAACRDAAAARKAAVDAAATARTTAHAAARAAARATVLAAYPAFGAIAANVTYATLLTAVRAGALSAARARADAPRLRAHAACYADLVAAHKQRDAARAAYRAAPPAALAAAECNYVASLDALRDARARADVGDDLYDALADWDAANADYDDAIAANRDRPLAVLATAKRNYDAARSAEFVAAVKRDYDAALSRAAGIERSPDDKGKGK